MPPEVVAFLSDPLTWIVGAVLVGLGKVGLDRYITKSVEHRFDLRVEDHRHRLQLTAEQARYDFQRHLGDYDRYAAKRFEAVEVVFAATRIAHGAVTALFGVRRIPSFEGFNLADIRKFLLEQNVPQGRLQQIEAAWQAEPAEGVELVQDYLRELEVHTAGVKLQEARNELYLKELYVSAEASDRLDELFAALWDWLYIAENPDHGLERKHSRDDIHALLSAVREALYADLASTPREAAEANERIEPPESK